MIQIDDAGSGSLIGGTCIGAIRVETNEYVFDFIPVSYYRNNMFSSKEYLNKACQIVFGLLKRLNWESSERLDICQGYMFDKLREELKYRNVFYRSVKINEPLQPLIEKTFQEYALMLGLPIQYVKYTKYPLHFHRILRWVYADYDNRIKLCKTGWKSWKKYGNLKVLTGNDVLYNSNFICLKCGETIKKGSKVKRLEYTSNCLNVIYLHNKCPYDIFKI
ncbi:MAG: hypothetical protein ACOX22_10540 [Caldicoprobacterales bacterium]|jgi:hypothetical protein|nr:hypothetical protein [Clostridiales bacterium]